MKSWTPLAAALILSLAAVSAARADLPPPPNGRPAAQQGPRTPGVVAMEIVPVSDPREIRLEIPRRLLNSGQAGAVGVEPPVSGSFTDLRTVIAGMALSLGLALGGLWLFRTRRRPVSGTVLLLLCAGGLGATLAGGARANMAPPFARPPLPDPIRLDAPLRILDNGTAIRLYIPPSRLAAFQTGAGSTGSAPRR